MFYGNQFKATVQFPKYTLCEPHVASFKAFEYRVKNMTMAPW